MGVERTILTNVTGGEVSPYLNARVDQSRYFNSAAELENFIVTQLGAIDRRGGTRFVAEVKNSANPGALIPFEHSDDDYPFQIEFGHQYLRFYKQKSVVLNLGVPYEIATPYAAADVPQIRYGQSNDVMYLVHPNYAPRVLTRLGDTNWTLALLEIKDGPYQNENATKITLKPSVIDGEGRTLIAEPNGKAVTAAGAGTAGRIRLTVNAHGYASGDPVIVAAVGGTVEANGKWTAIKIDANFIELRGSTFVHAYTAGGTVSANIFDAARDIGRLVRVKQGTNWGNAVITGVTNEYTAVVDVKSPFLDLTAVPSWRLGLWSDLLGWPRSVTVHQERLTFGSKTKLRPQRVDGSVIGAFDETSVNMAPTATDGSTADTYAISYNIGADQVSPVSWLISNGVLFVGTKSGPFVVSGNTTKAALKPTEGNSTPQGRRRCADAAALVIDTAIIYIDRLKRKIRELKYDLGSDSYDAPDLARDAEKATRSGIEQLVLQQDPFDIFWARRRDGQLVGCTYVPKEQVRGFHRHILAPTRGGVAVVECESTNAGQLGSDELWLLVRRVINGQTKRYIEILEDPLAIDGDQKDGFYVDCGLSYTGPAPVGNTLTGADHAEGETFQVVVNGAVQSDKVVTGGAIVLDDLPAGATEFTIHAGLGYRSLFRPLPLEAGASGGTAQGAVKIIRQMAVRVLRSFGGKAGPSLDKLQDIVSDRDPSVPMDSAMPLFTGDADVAFPGDYDKEGNFYVVQDRPLPLTIAGVIVKVEASDE
jgi:hypothetical protein